MRWGRALRCRFGIAASPLAVRRRVAWYWRLPMVALLLAIGAVVSLRMYGGDMQVLPFGRGAAFEELERLRDRALRLEDDNQRLRSIVAQHDQQIQMERATQADLAKTVKALQDENATLKEDVAFFRKLMSSDRTGGGLSIYRFLVERSVLPGEYRYRLLLSQGGEREREFQGHMQLLVNLTQDGRPMVVTEPANPGEAKAYQVSFKFYQRLEGTFRVAPGALVRNVQLRVFESGSSQPKLMQTVNLS
jgi:hypothetical protein